jgi:colanic acid/amylovoran biosynthesis protein
LIIEIRKAGFSNKGAELMLLSIVARLRVAYPDATLTMTPSSPNGSEPFAKLTALGLYPKASLHRLGVEWGDAASLIPHRLRQRYGLVLDREVDVVIDAAGFAYSDQWGAASSLELQRTTRRWRRRGTRVILMPQAFGPFTNPVIRSAILSSVDNADLVMPRDAVSYRYLTEVTGERDYIQQYPDFTNLIEGIVPRSVEPETFGVAIVPNVRMIDKTEKNASDQYLPFMIRCAERLLELNARPYLLVHEGVDDKRLAEQISQVCGGVPIVMEDDPLRIKGILGSSDAVVASRYHALVSALSQGVPAVATGWSHKYNELFEDYSFAEGVLSIDDDFANTQAMLGKLVDIESNRAISAQLLQSSARLKVLSEAMWTAVQSVIDGCPKGIQ